MRHAQKSQNPKIQHFGHRGKPCSRVSSAVMSDLSSHPLEHMSSLVELEIATCNFHSYSFLMLVVVYVPGTRSPNEALETFRKLHPLLGTLDLDHTIPDPPTHDQLGSFKSWLDLNLSDLDFECTPQMGMGVFAKTDLTVISVAQLIVRNPVSLHPCL